MIMPNVIDIKNDIRFFIPSDAILRSDDHLRFGGINVPYTFTIKIHDAVATGSAGDLSMSSDILIDGRRRSETVWSFNIPEDMRSFLKFDRKYVAEISLGADIIPFMIEEFSTTDSLDVNIHKYPYQLVQDGGAYYVAWYESVADFLDQSGWIYRAPAYTGSTGTTPATSIANMTHRGMIVRNEA